MEKLKLLIAEDSKLLRSMYNGGFSDDLFEKRFAENGEDLLRIFNSWRPDILITDVMMPIITGYEALKEIRKIEPVAVANDTNHTKKSTVIIIATAMGSKEDIMDFLKLGINGYLIKPLSKNKMQKKVMDVYLKIYPGRSVSMSKEAGH